MITFQHLKRNIKKDASKLPALKISLLGDTATQFLGVAVCGMGYERGYQVNFYEAEYNQIEQQVLDPTSDLQAHNADYTLLFQSTHKLLEHYSLLASEAQASLAANRLDFLRTVCSRIAGRIIVFNYPEIEDGIFGSYANKVSSSFTYQVRKLNFELMNLAQEFPNLFVCDLAAIQNKVGRNMLFDPVVYTHTEMVLSIDSLPLIASRVWDIIGAAQGKFKKCLILDLDNTLWGGVVGDDGWENIQIGHGLGIGKVFTEFQEWVLKLKNRGIIIAICSKNDEDKAKEPFEKNPEMVLHLDDIAVFVANWENKADNIRHIQQILNIGFDSMCFLDDNPFERNLVRENIIGITVPDLPEDPALYLEYLYEQNLFETISYSGEDTARTKQYQVEAQRVQQQQLFTNEADFLASLNMISEVQGFDKFNTPRVAQLSQRSNQFNLRTVRYTEAEIVAIAAGADYVPFAFTLADKFGDNGLISVIILHKDDTRTLFVDTWFMSCRVLKRGMENFVLNTIVDYAQANGFTRIVGEYIPTAKNQMVAEHYTKLGFDPIEGLKNRYSLEVNDYTHKENFITRK